VRMLAACRAHAQQGPRPRDEAQRARAAGEQAAAWPGTRGVGGAAGAEAAAASELAWLRFVQFDN